MPRIKLNIQWRVLLWSQNHDKCFTVSENQRNNNDASKTFKKLLSKPQMHTHKCNLESENHHCGLHEAFQHAEFDSAVC